jgi:Zn-dependent protease with chaperone function
LTSRPRGVRSAGRKKVGSSRRLQTPLTAAEIVLLVLGLAVGVFISSAGVRLMNRVLPQPTEIGTMLLYLLGAIALPCFVAPLVGMAVPSWRYKTVCGVLLLFVLTGFAVVDVARVIPRGFSPFLGGLIRFGARIIPALVAFRVWRALQDAHAAARGKTGVVVHPLVSETVPGTPLFLVVLAAVSIPLVYASLVLSMFATIGLAALIYLVLSQAHRVPVVIIVATVLAPLAAAWASITAVRVALAPPRGLQPARVLPLAERPALKALVTQVCTAVGARMPDNVILNANPTFYVTQAKLTTFDGPLAGRTLGIGLPLVKTMAGEELAAVLAHEFAHFTGRDTLYSAAAAPVFGGLQASVQALGRTRTGGSLGVLMWVLKLPSVHFLVDCALYFQSITMVLSRRRELRADWIAASHFGTGPFVSALRKSVGVARHFDEAMQRLSWEGAEGFFTAYAALLGAEGDKVESASEKAQGEVESELDSHPSLRTRVESLPSFAGTAVGVTTAQIAAELAEDEKALSAKFAPLIADYQEKVGAVAATAPSA